jgi:hypothetical protein
MKLKLDEVEGCPRNVTLESWLFAHGDIVWKLLLVGFALTGSLVLPLWARRRRHRQNLDRLGRVVAPRVRAPDPGLVGQPVVIHGTLEARHAGQAASTVYVMAGAPLDVQQSGPLAMNIGQSMLPIHGAVEVCVGSTVTTHPSDLGSSPAQCFSVAHGDSVAAYGVLERVPGSAFEGYRQDAGAWRLCPGPGDDHVRMFFVGKPRAPWLRCGAIGAVLMAMVFYVTSSIAGYLAVNHPALTVWCDGYVVSVPAASAVASATPAFRDWGLRRQRLYQPCMREPGAGSLLSMSQRQRPELPTWPSD